MPQSINAAATYGGNGRDHAGPAAWLPMLLLGCWMPDAVSGVVNFILDKKFTGLKGEYEYGVTTYGDGANHKISVTGGLPFADGKGHILLSGEYFTQKGIQSINRDWNNSGSAR